MKFMLLIIIFARSTFAEEDVILTENEIGESSGIAVEEMIGKKFKGVAIVEIVRSVPLVYFNVPKMEKGENGRAAHLISLVPDSSFEKLKIGTKIEIEAMIVDQGYGAIMMYVYSVKIIE